MLVSFSYFLISGGGATCGWMALLPCSPCTVVLMSTGVPAFTNPAADATSPAQRFRAPETAGAAGRPAESVIKHRTPWSGSLWALCTGLGAQQWAKGRLCGQHTLSLPGPERVSHPQVARTINNLQQQIQQHQRQLAQALLVKPPPAPPPPLSLHPSAGKPATDSFPPHPPAPGLPDLQTKEQQSSPHSFAPYPLGESPWTSVVSPVTRAPREGTGQASMDTLAGGARWRCSPARLPMGTALAAVCRADRKCQPCAVRSACRPLADSGHHHTAVF